MKEGNREKERRDEHKGTYKEKRKQIHEGRKQRGMNDGRRKFVVM